MRRYISLFCVCLVFIMCLAAPVSAADYSTWNSIFDYSTRTDVADPNSRFISLESQSTYKARWSFPSDIMISSLDLVLFAKGGQLSSVTWDGTALTILQIGSSNSGTYYRVHRDLSSPREFDHISLTFTGSLGSVIYVESFNIRSVGMEHVDISGSGSFYAGLESSNFTYPINISRSVGVTENEDAGFHVRMILDPNKYDYNDFIFFVRNLNITAVSCYIDNVIIPVEVFALNGNASNDSYSAYNVRVDFTEFSRDVSGSCILYISGYVPTPGLNTNVSVQFSVVAASGYILSQSPDSNIFWLKTIWSDLGSWFSELNTDIQSYILDFKSDVAVKFSSLNDNLDSNFAELIDVLSPDTLPADQLQSQVDQQANDLNQISGALEGLDTPSLDSISGNLSNYVDMDQLYLAGAPMRLVLNNNFFQNLFMVAFTLMLASYVLYGKR